MLPGGPGTSTHSTQTSGPGVPQLRNPGVDPNLWHLITAYSSQLRLDPYAVAAVSRVEGGGRYGEVGDSGTSFGPFQLHVGGALPQGRDAAWANSPAGIYYAMSHMAASGAAGLRGINAVRAIVTRFERPAAPGPEVASAWSGYRSFGGDPNFNTQAGNPSVDPGFNANGGSWQSQMQPYLAQQAQQFAKMQATQLNQFKVQMAQSRQQSLGQTIAAQAQQRVAGAQAAQQGLGAGGYAGAAATPTDALAQQRRDTLTAIHQEALRRAGVL